MAIKSGIGIGAAQVFDTRGIMNTYFKLLQKNQAEQQKYQNELANSIANIDINGINEADKPEIAKMYESIKDLYGAASSAKNSQQKALLKAKVAKSVNDLNQYAQNSKNFVKKYAELSKDIASNSWSYDPKMVEEFRGLINQPLSKLGTKANLDPFDYQKLPDAQSRSKAFQDINKKGEDFAEYDFKSAGKGREQYIGVLSDDKISGLIAKKLSENPEYKALAFSSWSAANPGKELDIKGVILNELDNYKVDYTNFYKKDPVRIPKEPKGDTIIIGGEAIQPKTFYSDEQKVKDKSGKTVIKPSSKMVEFDSFIGVNPQQFSLPQLDKRLNITTGKWEPYRSSGNVEIVGVGRRSGSGAYNVIVQDKDGFEYMVTEQDLPVGIRNNKMYQAARASVYRSRPSTPAPSPSPSPKPKINY